MEYNGEGIEALVSVLEDMKNTNLILVDKKVKSLLKCLAYYDEFRTVLAYCNKNLDYQAEKKKCLIKIGERDVVRMPKNEVNIVAFVSNLLIDFDEGKIDLVSFSSDYFPSFSNKESFDAFFNAIIIPFKLALVGLVVEGIPEDAPLIEKSVEFASNGLQQQTEYLLVAIIKKIQEAQIEQELRDDFTLMIEGFASALDTRDLLMIKAIWTGIKRLLKINKLCGKEIQKVDDILRLYMVIK